MSGLQDAAIQAAETIQTAHIKHHPDVKQDLAPSTAADTKQRVEIDDNIDLDDGSDVAEDEIPVSILRPTPRRPQMPPLPDLRFEQSYLASIKEAKGWQGVAFITIRDQVCVPQGRGIPQTDITCVGIHAPRPGHGMDSHRLGLAILESRHQVLWTDCGSKD